MVAPVRLVRRISTDFPTAPEPGCIFSNRPRPADRLKTVPQPLGQLTGVPAHHPLLPPLGVSIGVLNQGSGVFAVSAIGAASGAKAVWRHERTARRNLKDRPALAVGPASTRCPVEVPIRGLDQPRLGQCAVRAMTTTLGARAVSAVSLPRRVIVNLTDPETMESHAALPSAGGPGM